MTEPIITPLGALIDALQIALLISEVIARTPDQSDECCQLVQAVQHAALAAHAVRGVIEVTDGELVLLREALDATIHERDHPTDDLLTLQARIHVLTGDSTSPTNLAP